MDVSIVVKMVIDHMNVRKRKKAVVAVVVQAVVVEVSSRLFVT